MNTLLGFPGHATTAAFGRHLKQWRTARHMSQLALATEAGVSARHLSFLETGRAQPSREMVQLLAGMLDVPLGERNALLVSAGYAPAVRRAAAWCAGARARPPRAASSSCGSRSPIRLW